MVWHQCNSTNDNMTNEIDCGDEGEYGVHQSRCNTSWDYRYSRLLSQVQYTEQEIYNQVAKD